MYLHFDVPLSLVPADVDRPQRRPELGEGVRWIWAVAAEIKANRPLSLCLQPSSWWRSWPTVDQILMGLFNMLDTSCQARMVLARINLKFKEEIHFFKFFHIKILQPSNWSQSWLTINTIKLQAETCVTIQKISFEGVLQTEACWYLNIWFEVKQLVSFNVQQMQYVVH